MNVILMMNEVRRFLDKANKKTTLLLQGGFRFYEILHAVQNDIFSNV